MATKKEPQSANHDRAKLVGTLIGAVVVSLLSSGALNKLTDDDVKKDVSDAVKGSDMGTALYLSALRDSLEARHAMQNARIADLEAKVAALRAAGSRAPASVADELPRLSLPEPSPLPAFEVRQ
jgi:hypothetical protein